VGAGHAGRRGGGGAAAAHARFRVFRLGQHAATPVVAGPNALDIRVSAMAVIAWIVLWRGRIDYTNRLLDERVALTLPDAELRRSWRYPQAPNSRWALSCCSSTTIRSPSPSSAAPALGRIVLARDVSKGDRWSAHFACCWDIESWR
jgi:hypothetical protein